VLPIGHIMAADGGMLQRCVVCTHQAPVECKPPCGCSPRPPIRDLR